MYNRFIKNNPPVMKTKVEYSEKYQRNECYSMKSLLCHIHSDLKEEYIVLKTNNRLENLQIKSNIKITSAI